MSPLPPGGLEAPRPAAGRARSPLAPRLGTSSLTSLLLAAVVACGPAVPTPPTPSPSPGPSVAAASPAERDAFTRPGLLQLADDGGGGATLDLVRASGEIVPLPVPDPATAAMAPTTGGQLVAILRDGRAFVAPGGPTGLLAGTGWGELVLRGPGAMPPGAIVWSATASPGGTRIGAIARQRDTGTPSALLVIEPGRGRRDVLPLPDESEGLPPAWIDETHVVIVQRDRFDRPFPALVEIGTGKVTDRLPIRASDLGTSRDARTAFVLIGNRITVGPTASMLASRHAPESGPAMPPGDLVRGGIALSGDGRCLAVTVQEGDGGPVRIAIYVKTAGAWRAADRIALPIGAPGGWIAWLA